MRILALVATAFLVLAAPALAQDPAPATAPAEPGAAAPTAEPGAAAPTAEPGAEAPPAEPAAEAPIAVRAPQASPSEEPTALAEPVEEAESADDAPPQRDFVVGVVDGVPGFSALGPFGLRVGFDVDVALALCERIAARCTLMPLPVDGIYDALNERRVSLAVAGVAPYAVAAGNVLKTEPYLELVQRFVVPRGARRTREEGQGVRRAALEGTQQAQYLRDQTSTTDRVVIYSNTDGMWIDLAMGRLDAALALGLLARREFLATPLGDDFRFAAASEGLESGPAVSVPVLVRPGEEALRDELDRAIADFVQSPEYARLLFRHLDTDLAHAPTPPEESR